MKRHRLNILFHAERVEFKDAVEAGLIRPIQSQFGRQFFFVRRADGSLQLCMDYRGLIQVTRKGAYPLARVNDNFDEY
jgi:hypothetical protein